MTQFQLIALDVGGVIYYDEPFELAWIHQILARARAAESSFTVSSLIRDMAIFYASAQTPHDRTKTVFSQPLARRSWLNVRAQWGALVQPVPGAVDAVRQLANRYDLCVVANQPPECAEALEQFRLSEVVKIVALDSIVGYAKPDSRLLGWALGRLGVLPAQTLVVGNRWDHDIAPARALGCLTTLIRRVNGWSAPPGCDPDIVAAYQELRSEAPSPAAGIDAVPVAESVAELAVTLIPTP